MTPNFDFRQIETSLIAFVEDIEKKLQEMIPDLPVFVLQTGDASYVMDTKFLQKQTVEIYEKVPRFVITFDSFSHERDMDTNIYNRYNYVYNNEIYTVEARRLQIDISVTGTFVSSNFIEGLKHMEMILSIIRRENAFTYKFAGNTYEAAFYCESMQDVEFPDFDNATTRNFIHKLQIILQTHIFIPRINTIEKYADTVNKGMTSTIGINDTIISDKYNPHSLTPYDPNNPALKDSTVPSSVVFDEDHEREEIDYPYHTPNEHK
jgi:hypothetical protein